MRIVALLGMSLFAFWASAAAVKGKVKDIGNGYTGIVGADVKITAGRVTKEEGTGNGGEYKFTGIPNNTDAHITCTTPGYTTDELDAQTKADPTEADDCNIINADATRVYYQRVALAWAEAANRDPAQAKEIEKQVRQLSPADQQFIRDEMRKLRNRSRLVKN